MEDEDAMSDNSLPFGYGASAFGSEAEEEEEDVVVHRELALRAMEWESATQRYLIKSLLQSLNRVASSFQGKVIQARTLARSLQITS